MGNVEETGGFDALGTVQAGSTRSRLAAHWPNVALLLTPCANATQQRQAPDALASDALQASGGVIHLSVGGVYCVDAFAFDVAAHRLDTARAALTLDIALDASRFETLRGCVCSRRFAPVVCLFCLLTMCSPVMFC